MEQLGGGSRTGGVDVFTELPARPGRGSQMIRRQHRRLRAARRELGSIHRAHIRFPNVTSVPLFARSSFETSRAFPTDSPPERREQQ